MLLLPLLLSLLRLIPIGLQVSRWLRFALKSDCLMFLSPVCLFLRSQVTLYQRGWSDSLLVSIFVAENEIWSLRFEFCFKIESLCPRIKRFWSLCLGFHCENCQQLRTSWTYPRIRVMWPWKVVWLLGCAKGSGLSFSCTCWPSAASSEGILFQVYWQMIL